MGITEFSQIEGLFASRNVCQIYIKHLSKKQDNDKNQIYLGTGLGGVVNLFPAILSLRSTSKSKQKRKSNHGQFIIEARLDFEWLKSDGTSYPAPETKIIDYFQYPEVRMSGFLTKCISPPDALRRTRQQIFGKRILILGSNNEGKTYGLVLINDIKWNMTLASLKNRFSNKESVIDKTGEIMAAEDYCSRINIKTNSVNNVVENLSGGNQQKVVLAKWMLSDPDVLLMDEPTRGIDVGAKYEIYSIINLQ